MTNFRLAQERALRASRSLVAIYIAAVIVISISVLPLVVIISTVLFGVSILFSKHGGVERMGNFFEGAWQAGTWVVTTETGHVVAGVGMSAATLIILTASLSRFLDLRAGGMAVAESVGGRLLAHGTADADERRVMNVVEEMAIASALPVPPVYVLSGERGVNAFAAGYSPSDAVVGVTDGCIRRLTRDQLQGVIAHEFGHIRSGDMRLNIRLIGLLHGIVVVGETGSVLLNLQIRKNPFAIPGLAMMIVGGVGTFLGSVIRAAVNRGREYLADACAVEFTRYPDGLADALKVVGGDSHRGRIETSRIKECSHMLFVSGLGSWTAGLRATHPPLEGRVRRLDPKWDGNWLVGRPLPASSAKVARVLVQQVQGEVLGRARGAVGFVEAMVPAKIAENVEEARERIASLPGDLLRAARDACDARLLVYGMLMDRREEVAATQRSMVQERLGVAAVGEVERLRGLLAGSVGARLPLLEIALGSLAALTGEQYAAFRGLIEEVVRADERVSLFEWCLQRLLLIHLDRRHGDARLPSTQYYSLKGLVPQCSVLLSAVAHAGRGGGAGVAGADAKLGVEGLKLVAAPECTPERLSDSMDRLALASLRLRRQVVVVCSEMMMADGVLGGAEAELLRAIADGLDVPLAMAG